MQAARHGPDHLWRRVEPTVLIHHHRGDSGPKHRGAFGHGGVSDLDQVDQGLDG